MTARQETSLTVRKPTVEDLTRKVGELEKSVLIKEGKTSKEIAECLNVSMSAVHICRCRIRNKLDLNKTKSNRQSSLSCLA